MEKGVALKAFPTILARILDEQWDGRVQLVTPLDGQLFNLGERASQGRPQAARHCGHNTDSPPFPGGESVLWPQWRAACDRPWEALSPRLKSWPPKGVTIWTLTAICFASGLARVHRAHRSIGTQRRIGRISFLFVPFPLSNSLLSVVLVKCWSSPIPPSGWGGPRWTQGIPWRKRQQSEWC